MGRVAKAWKIKAPASCRASEASVFRESLFFPWEGGTMGRTRPRVAKLVKIKVPASGRASEAIVLRERVLSSLGKIKAPAPG